MLRIYKIYSAVPRCLWDSCHSTRVKFMFNSFKGFKKFRSNSAYQPSRKGKNIKIYEGANIQKEQQAAASKQLNLNNVQNHSEKLQDKQDHLQVKNLMKNQRLAQIIAELQSKNHLQLSKQITKTSTTQKRVNQFVYYLAQSSLILDLSQDADIIETIINNIFLQLNARLLWKQESQPHKYQMFLLKYQSQIVQIMKPESYPFSKYIFFYKIIKQMVSQVEAAKIQELKDFIFKRLLQSMSWCDLSSDQNFPLVMSFLVRQEERRIEKDTMQFMDLVFEQLPYFPFDKLKRCAIILIQYFFIFTVKMFKGYLQILTCYNQNFINQLSSYQLLHIFNKLAPMTKNYYAIEMRDQVFQLYLKNILSSLLSASNRYSADLIKKIIKAIGFKIDFSPEEQLHLSQIVFRYFQMQIDRITAQSMNKLQGQFYSIYSLLQILAIYQLFQYQICKTHYSQFAKYINNLINLYPSLHSHQLVTFLNQEVMVTDDTKDEFFLENLKRINLKKKYKLLVKALKTSDIEIIKAVVANFFDAKSGHFYPYIKRYYENYVDLNYYFTKAIKLLFQKQQIQIFKQVIYQELCRANQDTRFVNQIIKVICKTNQIYSPIIWRSYFQAWLKVSNDKQNPEKYVNFFFVTLVRYLNKQLRQQDFFDSPQFYQIINVVWLAIQRNQVQNPENIIYFFQFINYLLSEEYSTILLNSLIGNTIKKIMMTQQIQQIIGDSININELNAKLIKYKLKNGLDSKQIPELYKKVVVDKIEYISEYQKLIIMHLYQSIKSTIKVPSVNYVVTKQNVILFLNNKSFIKNQIISNQIMSVLQQCDQFQLLAMLNSRLTSKFINKFIRTIWRLFLDKQLNFKYLFWLPLIYRYEFSHNLDHQFKALVRKIMIYYTTNSTYLSQFYFKMIYNVAISTQAFSEQQVAEPFCRAFVNNFIKTKVSMSLQAMYNLLMPMLFFGYKIDFQLALQLFPYISHNWAGYIILFNFQYIFSKQQFQILLKKFIKHRVSFLNNNQKMESNQTIMYLQYKYPEIFQQCFLSLSQTNDENHKKYFFLGYEQIPTIMRKMKQQYYDIQYNQQNSYAIYNEYIIVFAQQLHIKAITNFFKKLILLLPQNSTKTVKIFKIFTSNEDNYFNANYIQRELGLKKRPIVSNNPQSQPNIKNLQLQTGLSEEISKLESQILNEQYKNRQNQLDYEGQRQFISDKDGESNDLQ